MLRRLGSAKKRRHCLLEFFPRLRSLLMFSFFHDDNILDASVLMNSKERRKQRRLLLSEGLVSLREIRAMFPPTLPIKRASVWSRIPKWIYGAVALAALLITLAQGYPRFAVTDGPLLDSNNPYSEAFFVVNQGYIPATRVDAECRWDWSTTNDNVGNNFAQVFKNFVFVLPHGRPVTIPCFSSNASTMFSESNSWGTVKPGSRLIVQFEYSVWGIPMRRVREGFAFWSAVGKDGTQHWIFR
jgi:hypothetical protein